MGGITGTVVSGPFLVAGLLALAAGLVSFASPCVVPLVPGYVSYLAGLVGAEARTGAGVGRGGSTLLVGAPRAGVRLRAVGAAALFVAGFSLVFVAESSLVLGIYTSIVRSQVWLERVSGAVVVVMGLVLAAPALQREWRPGMRGAVRAGRGRLWGAPLLGAAFGTGWLACTSPTLAGILALSTTTDWNGNAVRGLALVVLYCLGLGIPFLLLALGFGWAGSALAFLRAHARVIQLAGAAVLVVMGVAMLTGVWGYVLAPLQGTVLLL